MQEAAIAGIQHAEAILAWLDIQKRKSFSVDKHDVAKNFGNPGHVGIAGHGIVELAVLLEQTIINDERDFEGALGKVERIFKIVANEEQPEHSRINVQAIDAHGVVVIPERGSILAVGI